MHNKEYDMSLITDIALLYTYITTFIKSDEFFPLTNNKVTIYMFNKYNNNAITRLCWLNKNLTKLYNSMWVWKFSVITKQNYVNRNSQIVKSCKSKKSLLLYFGSNRNIKYIFTLVYINSSMYFMTSVLSVTNCTTKPIGNWWMKDFISVISILIA